jgi:hypothetical protein
MPFTATRSGATATATLAYSYPLVVGDEFTVTGASNSEWNTTYTIASVVSGTSVTFTVPATHSATAGTGAAMQTTGTAVLDPAAVALAVWGAASRTITGGLVDTATTLTNAPTVPTPSQIASQVRTELSTELSRLDVATSTRAVAADIPTSDISAIKSKTDALPSDPADQSLVEAAIFGLTIPSVVQIRTELDSNSTKLANLDATISSRSTLTTGDLPSVPSAASVASAVRTELTELSNLDASVSSRLASAAYTAPTSAPTAAAVASAVRAELTELSNLDATISSRLAGSAYTAPSTPPTASVIASAVWAAADKTGYSLTSAERSAIATAVETSILNEADGQQILNAIVGAIGNSNVDQVALVAAIRSDLERSGGKIDSIPTTSAPTAAENASAVWGASAKVITGGVVDTLTNAPASVTPTDIWSHATRTLTSANGPTATEIRQEMDSNSTKLSAIKTKTDNLPADPADQSLLEAAIAGVAAPTAGQVASQVRTELSSELAKVAALNTERLANVATTAIVGNLIAQANS